jgi:tRNA-dihydrouridine synthase A
VAAAGCTVFIVHARNAVLKGLSPKENREVPPLRYAVVHQLQRDFPEATFVLNGGLKSLPDVERELAHTDGVMLGRAAYHDPYLLALLDAHLFGDGAPPPSRVSIIHALVPYVQAQQLGNVPLRNIARHVLGLYHGMPGGRRFRQLLSDAARLKSAGAELLLEALDAVTARDDADAAPEYRPIAA